MAESASVGKRIRQWPAPRPVPPLHRIPAGLLPGARGRVIVPRTSGEPLWAFA